MTYKCENDQNDRHGLCSVNTDILYTNLIWQFCLRCLLYLDRLLVVIRGVSAIYRMFLQYSVKFTCCVINSERKDQSEDQGEVLVSCRKLLQRFDRQQVELEP